MGVNGTNIAIKIVFKLTGRRGEFPARGAPWKRAPLRTAEPQRLA